MGWRLQLRISKRMASDAYPGTRLQQRVSVGPSIVLAYTRIQPQRLATAGGEPHPDEEISRGLELSVPMCTTILHEY